MHATDAPFTVTHAGGSSTVTANQRANGGTWNLLGTYSFDSGTDYKVELSDAVAAGTVAADAIYIAPATAPASDAFTWTPAIPGSGMYRVYARWPASSANTDAAQYAVTHGGGTSAVTLNQKQNGGSWVPLGSWSFAPGAGHKVTLAAAADGTTIADAMLFVAAGAQPANLLYVHPDHLGSPQKLTDASQATVWDGVFDPFGEEVAVAGLAAMQMRFPGQYADEETGYRYNYFRDYEPRIGRYIQSDPIGLRGGLSTYAYTLNNPVGYTDQRGLILDTAADVGFVCGDVLKILIDNVILERGNLKENLGALGADAVALATPFATGAGQVYRAGAKAAKQIPDRLPDDAIVCRGGQCTADSFINGTGVTVDANGKLNNVSVVSAPGKSLDELTADNYVPHKKVGETTVGEIRKAGGDVIPSPSLPNNPDHCTMCGITPQQAEELFTPTVKNPNPR